MDRSRIIERLKRQTLNVDSSSYRIERELGRGGNGVAFQCKRIGTGTDVVAKLYVPPDSRDLDDRALERFNNEIALTSRLKHPHIVQSLGAAAVEVGAYKLPFYLMPLAASTMRNVIRIDTEAEEIEKKVRMFLHACYGVTCLHNHGVVHRDLKPENILIGKRGEPWVADLGIAHVNPEFVSVGLKTIASERLLNRDYYAPEQRFGPATTVDNRADIYALGCILYELLTSIPPVRSGAPPPSGIATVLAPFDVIWQRMTAWKPEDRYATLEYAFEDVAVALGAVLAILKGTPGVRHPDLKTMTKLLRSRNEAQRQQGIDIAIRLGKSALTELHSLLGHEKREVRNSVATALGQIADPSSLPFLMAGMYGNTNKVGHFRPAADTAADAIARYPVDDRIRCLGMLEHPVRPVQLRPILKGLPTDVAYDAVVGLRKRERLLLDFTETELALLAEVDEDRAWPQVSSLLSEGNDYKIKQLIQYLSLSRKIDVLRQWINRGASWDYYFRDQIDSVDALDVDANVKDELFAVIERKVNEHSFKSGGKSELLKQIRFAREQARPIDAV
jgi:serine/threonine protein kinase